jgi:AraC-like DNA-binding protein
MKMQLVIQPLHYTVLSVKLRVFLADVSWQCGFDNPSAFGRAFKAQYGIQPAQYRRAGRVGKDI